MGHGVTGILECLGGLLGLAELDELADRGGAKPEAVPPGDTDCPRDVSDGQLSHVPEEQDLTIPLTQLHHSSAQLRSDVDRR